MKRLFERTGRIYSADIITDDHGFLMFTIGFRLEHTYVSSIEAGIPIGCVEECKPNAFSSYTQGFLKNILKTLKKARVDAISDLVGKKVICYDDGFELKRWELAK